MNQTITKATVSVLLALVCLALFASSAQAVQIRAETGAALPSSIIVNENLTVLITDDAGAPINGVTENARVRYILPADGGTPIPVGVGSDGKTVNPYKPPMTGVLNITVSYGTTLMASQTVNVISTLAIRAADGGDLPPSIPVGETFTVLITEDGISVGAGTNVLFTLPYGTGSPTLDTTDADGKAQYLPENTGTLGIRVLDGTDTVAEANVTVTIPTEIQTLGSVVISPDSVDLSIGETKRFIATCYDTSGNPMSSGYTLTWTSDSSAVGTIDFSGLFTAGGVGTATVTVTAIQGSVTRTDTAIVNVSALTETVPVDGADFPETSVPAGTAADITVNGTFDHDVAGSIDMTAVPNPEETVGSYTLTAGSDEALMGLTVTPDATIAAELADGNGTIRIEICYNETELVSKGISSSTLAIYRYDDDEAEWVKMVAGTPPCVDNGITGTCVWIVVNDLSTFALVGKTVVPPVGGGGGSGTYPPGWGGTLTATPGVTPGATPGATPGVTPPDEAVTTPTKPAVAEETAPEEAEETPTKKKTPGFTAVFAIAGLLAIAYVLMRRRD